MFVEEGYWNYYMAFQVRSNADVVKSLQSKKIGKYIVASYMSGEVLLSRVYGDANDEIMKAYIDKYVTVLKDTGDAIKEVHGHGANNSSFVSLLNPLKLLLRDGDEMICPLFMYMMNTGLGVLKLCVPLLNLDISAFKSMPLIKWYKSASLLYLDNQQSSIALSNDELGTVSDITALMQSVIKGVFDGCLITENMNLCFENILLSKTKKPNILSKSFKPDELREIYHICFPEESMQFPSDSVVNEFWRNQHKDIGGISFIKGMPARLVIYTDVKRWLEANNRLSCDNSLDYLENSIQYSFDWCICIVLFKKINEMNLFYSSDNNYHKINYNNAVYCLRENELDALMDYCPVNCKRVYDLVFEIMNSSLKAYDKRVDRLLKLEQYSKNLFDEKRNMIFEIMALCGTTIFGLPAIRDTIKLIRDVIFPLNADVISCASVNELSLIVWGLVIVYMLWRVIGLVLQYKKYKL